MGAGVAVGDGIAVATAIARPVGAVAGVAIGDAAVILRPDLRPVDQSERIAGRRGGADAQQEGTAIGASERSWAVLPRRNHAHIIRCLIRLFRK